MPFYQESRTMKAAVIGTIMSWSGPLSEIPDGWIICNGASVNAADYPLLVQAIGDTYNTGNSNLGGSGFPNYTGQIVLPDLLSNRFLMDIEQSYFTATGRTTPSTVLAQDPDQDSDAGNIIGPYIGENIEESIPTVFNDVFTDVEFTLNDRNGFSGNIKGNTIIDGVGEKSVYVGGRKLGHQHVRSHTHSGSYETIAEANRGKPGDGVVPYDNITFNINYAAIDVRTTLTVPGTSLTYVPPAGGADDVRFGLEFYHDGTLLDDDNWSTLSNSSGFGSGDQGRTVAKCSAGELSNDFIPEGVRWTPIARFGECNKQVLTSGEVVPYAQAGANLQIPVGNQNYYESNTSILYQTMTSNTATFWTDAEFFAHTHDPFIVEYDQNSLKPRPTLTADVNFPVTKANMDNASNVGALQITMNTQQPSLTIVYIIRAY